MKTLSRFILKSFLAPFLMTFFIAVFVLFLQFLWKYVDDLIGKGLDNYTLAELFFYASLTMFPLALPLAMLLSSLMTFGDLGEHFELVALKSTGMSLIKIMRPLIILAIIISISAFFFSNNLLPFVNLKMSSLLYDIQQKKPSLKIKEGVFYNGIDNYTIRIEKKEKNGVDCKGIMIFDHTQNAGNNKVISADSGKLELTTDKQYLLVTLFHGTSFEETEDKNATSTHPLTRSAFKEEFIRLDLSGLRMVRSDEGLFKSSYAMLTLKQIENQLDSLQKEYDRETLAFKKDFYEDLINPAQLKNSDSNSTTIAIPQNTKVISADSLKAISVIQTKRKNEIALDIARSKKNKIENFIESTNTLNIPIGSLSAEWHKKFTLSIACLMLFFVGAPLGAIIRKGGLGMPVVVSVIIFILFWVITITGDKMTRDNAIPAVIGMWMASGVLFPLGIFLTIKATSDSTIFDFDSYLRFFRKFLPEKK